MPYIAWQASLRCVLRAGEPPPLWEGFSRVIGAAWLFCVAGEESFLLTIIAAEQRRCSALRVATWLAPRTQRINANERNNFAANCVNAQPSVGRCIRTVYGGMPCNTRSPAGVVAGCAAIGWNDAAAVWALRCGISAGLAWRCCQNGWTLTAA